MGGGGGTSINSQDAAYNSRMAGIAETELGWGSEFMNFYKYGVDFDPTEAGHIDSEGSWVPGRGETQTENPDFQAGHYKQVKDPNTGVTEKTWIPGNGEPEFLSTTDPNAEVILRGDYEQRRGYDPNGQASYRQFEQAQLSDNMEMLPHLTDQTIAESNFATEKAGAEKRLVSPYEKYTRGKLETDTRLLPGFEKATGAGYDYAADKMKSERGLISPREDLTRNLLKEQQQNVALRMPVNEKFFKSALEFDPEDRVAKATGDVASSFKGGGERVALNMSRYGGDPLSGRGRNEFSKEGLNFGRSLAGSRTQARSDGEREQFARLATAATSGPAINVN